MAPPVRPFEFIVVSGRNIKGDAATRKRVRSRAQADYRRRNPPAPRPAMSAELDVREWLQALSRDTATIQHSSAKKKWEKKLLASADGAISQSPSHFDRRGSDVFQFMTTAERRRTQLLWQHLYSGTCVVFKSMVEIGFLDLLQGSAALTQMLSSSAWHINNETHNESSNNIEYARYSVMATSSLRHMLSEPGSHPTIETVIAILTFAAYANLTSEVELVRIHLDGLCHVLSGVGGLPAIDSLAIVRTMVYWIDIRASFLQDTAPRFPQPFAIIDQRSEALARNKVENFAKLPNDAKIAHICESIQQVNIIIERHITAEGQGFLTHVLFPQFHLAPILHDLLSMPRATAVDDMPVQCGELFRLGAILYLRRLWARFGMDMTGDALYTSKLKLAWSQHNFFHTWCYDNALLLWILAVFTTLGSTQDAMLWEARTALQESIELCQPGHGNVLGALPRHLWCEPILGSLDTSMW